MQFLYCSWTNGHIFVVAIHVIYFIGARQVGISLQQLDKLEYFYSSRTSCYFFVVARRLAIPLAHLHIYRQVPEAAAGGPTLLIIYTTTSLTQPTLQLVKVQVQLQMQVKVKVKVKGQVTSDITCYHCFNIVTYILIVSHRQSMHILPTDLTISLPNSGMIKTVTDVHTWKSPTTNLLNLPMPLQDGSDCIIKLQVK